MIPQDDVLAPIRRAILDLRRLMPSVRSATVTGVNPLRVQFDGEAAPVSASPTSLVPVGPGDRVRVLHYGNTDLILGTVGNAAASTDPQWTSLTLLNGWESVAPAQARIIGGLVYLRGEIYGGSTGSGASNRVLLLPTRFRPPQRLRFPAGWGSRLIQGAHLALETNGELWTNVSAPSSPGHFLSVITPYPPAGGGLA